MIISPDHHLPKGDILIVDDQADNLRLLATMLTDQGYKIRKIIKSEMTFDVAQVNPPDLILLDIIMPVLDGFTVCQQLKSNPQTASIPIIFLSASDEPLDKVKAFSIGGEDYITKPFEIQEVVARIEHQLRLVRLQRHLQEQNQQLQVEISERRKIEAELQKVNEELEQRVQRRTVELTEANGQLKILGQQLQRALIQEQELSQIKTQMITTISHEYRTPMSIISSSAEMLENYLDRLTPDQCAKYVNRIHGAIQRMTELIDDVVFLNRIEFEAPEYLGMTVDLREAIDEAIATVKSQLNPSHHFHVQVEGAYYPRVPDRNLVTKILIHLLSNAVKFSPGGSAIEVHAGYTASGYVMAIKDSGIGIQPDEVERIFESFYRASNAEHIQGIGIGLSIVRRCIELLHGTIDMHSHEHAGTTVTVRLPAEWPAASSGSASSAVPQTVGVTQSRHSL